MTWRLPKSAPYFALVLACVFWRLSFQPFWHTDLWGHLSYGRWIVAHGRVPQTDVLQPLATGVRYIDTAWLSQVLLYELYRAAGTAGIQFLFAALVTGAAGLLAMSVWRLTARPAPGFVALGAFALLTYQQFLVGTWTTAALIRPQLFGVIAFVGLLTLVKVRPVPGWAWGAVPLLHLVWANLHGSFVMGLGLLGAFWLGRMVDLFRRTGSLSAVWHDRTALRYFAWLELSAVAALVNPYGIRLYQEVLTFSQNANLRDLVEWDALNFRTFQGQASFAMMLLLAAVYRLSPRRVSATEILLLVGLGSWTLWTSRMLQWWAVPAAYYLALHARAAWRAHHPQDLWKPEPRTGLATALTLGLVWLALIGSPLGLRVTKGKILPFDQAVSRYTPVRAVEYLVQNPPVGQVFQTYEWGDYLGWAGPDGVQVFCNSSAHLTPPEVWRHYQIISHAGPDWDDLLQRYGVNTVLIDKPDHGTLVRALRRDPQWKIGFEDGLAVVFTRRTPIRL